MFLQETYAIEDCYVYDTTLYEQNTTSYKSFDLNYTLPSNYSITWEGYANASNGLCYLIIGNDLQNRVTYGKIATNFNNQLMLHENNSSKSNQGTGNTMPNATWYTHSATVQNNTVTYENKMVTSSIVNLTNLLAIYLNNGKIRNIKVKAL